MHMETEEIMYSMNDAAGLISCLAAVQPSVCKGNSSFQEEVHLPQKGVRHFKEGVHPSERGNSSSQEEVHQLHLLQEGVHLQQERVHLPQEGVHLPRE